MKNITLWLKRGLKLVAVLFLSLVLFYGVARFYVVYTESQIEGDSVPVLQMQAPDSITLSWNTADEEPGVVRYGASPDVLDQTVKASEASYAHELRLTGLQPATRYYYSVGNAEFARYGGSAASWFMTAPEKGSVDAVRIWVLGDSGNPGPVVDSVRDAMKTWVGENPRPGKPYLDQWIMLGDNAYRSGGSEQYKAAVMDTFSEVLGNITLWPGYGNHDSRRWAFFKIFSLPENAESGGVSSGTEHYYSFDYANIHYVMLDSQESDRDPDGDMLSWLQRDLQANQQDWLIVAFHHPPYTKGSHDSDDAGDSGGRMVEMREYVLPVLEKYGVDLVLSGHSHVYERSHLLDCHYGDSKQFDQRNILSQGVEGNNAHYIKEKNEQTTSHAGAVYVVAGASSNVDNADFGHPAMAVAMMETGSLVIDIEGDVLTSRYINSNAIVVDEFTIEKKLGYRNENHTACQPN